MYRDPGLSSELSENGGPCTSTISFRAPPHLQQVSRELGIPAGPPLPGQGAGHPRKTASTQSGSWASQQDRVYPVRELGIPGGPPLPEQGAGHPRKTASTQAGIWASQEDRLYPGRELGIPGGPPLPSQGAGHPRRTASTWSPGAVAGRQVLGCADSGAGQGLPPDIGAACKPQLGDLPRESVPGFVEFPIRLMTGGSSSK